MKRRKGREMRRGFTLIELMVMVMVIGILALALYPGYSSIQTRALEAKVRANMSTTQIAVEQFATYTDGLYPQTFNNTVVATNPAIVGNSTTVAGMVGGYCPLAGTPSDPVLLPITMRNPVSIIGWAFYSQAAAVATPPVTPAIVIPACGGASDQGSVLYHSADIQGSAAVLSNARVYAIFGYGVTSVLPVVLTEKQ